MCDALRAAGERVELHRDHFEPNVEDSIWLCKAGKRRWIVLTKDRHIRSNQVEIEALIESQVACFTLTSAEMTGREMALAFVAALLQMRKVIGRFELPFVATVTRSGAVSMLYTKSRLLKKLR